MYWLFRDDPTIDFAGKNKGEKEGKKYLTKKYTALKTSVLVTHLLPYWQ
jgi:hypothetical protein